LALAAVALLIGCGDDGAGASPTDTAPDTTPSDATTSDATSAETAAGDTLGETSVTDAAPDVAAPALPALAEALIVTPGDGLGDVRVQPALAWGPPDEGRGRLVAAWTGASDDDLGIFVGAWDVDGGGLDEVAAPALVHVARDGLRNEPALCALAGGGFVVAWSEDRPDPSGANLHVAWRRLDASGAPLGASETEHVTDRPGNHWLAELACRPASDGGGFVLAGVRPGPEADMGFEVFVQPFDADGAPEGEVVAVLPRDEGGQAFPVVGVDGQGNLRVAWEDTVAASARTVIATRGFVRANGGYAARDRVELVGSASADAIAPVIAVHPVSGHALAGGVVGNRLRLALDVGAGYDPVALPEAASAVTTVAALAPIGEAGFTLVWFRGTGASVDVRQATIDDGVVSAATTVVSGSFPLAYRPALAVAPGFGAIGWTESLGSGRFAVRVALYRP